MEKEFIPYEEALALKNLGFNESCLCSYNNRQTPYFQIQMQGRGANKFNFYEQQSVYLVLAPLYQQALRWFREKYKLESSIQRMPPEVYGKGKGDIKNYLLYIWAENLNPRGQQTLHFDTYEEAELECLKRLIKIVKKNEKRRNITSIF